MTTKVIYGAVLVMLAAFSWMVIIFMQGVIGPFWLGLELLLGLGFVFGLIKAVRIFNNKVWLVAGLVILGGLIPPSSLLIEFESTVGRSLAQPVQTFFSLVLFFMLPAALFLAAILISIGLNALRQLLAFKETFSIGSIDLQNKARWTAAISFIMAVALLAKFFYNLYWLLVWDSTYDPLDFFWLAVPVLGALSAGVMLSVLQKGWFKLAAVYGLVIAGLMWPVYASAKQVDYHALTNLRAGQISQALERYFTQEGRYPENLHQLVPLYIFSLPSPVLINGQDWCYDGSGGTYRLGYTVRDHWSSPIFTSQVYRSIGETANLPPICASEIIRLSKRFQAP